MLKAFEAFNKKIINPFKIFLYIISSKYTVIKKIWIYSILKISIFKKFFKLNYLNKYKFLLIIKNLYHSIFAFIRYLQQCVSNCFPLTLN